MLCQSRRSCDDFMNLANMKLSGWRGFCQKWQHNVGWIDGQHRYKCCLWSHSNWCHFFLSSEHLNFIVASDLGFHPSHPAAAAALVPLFSCRALRCLGTETRVVLRIWPQRVWWPSGCADVPQTSRKTFKSLSLCAISLWRIQLWCHLVCYLSHPAQQTP
jgi:hypothetical protein